LTKTFTGGCIVTSFCIHSKSTKDIFLCIRCFHLQFLI
jgi:hypothetical protein